MGLATTGGAFLAVNPLAFLTSLGLLVLLVLVVRHSARASVFTGILAAPVLWLFKHPRYFDVGGSGRGRSDCHPLFDRLEPQVPRAMA